MEPLVSVIINVYNCKDYLPTSLGSVRQQTYKNLEVILVDDCSTDGSGEFCDEYCKQDERFRVIHHETNTGVSGPRNTGLKAAKGEYIYFMDSDDYIHERAIEKLVEAVEKTGCELAIFDFRGTDILTEDTHSPLQNYELKLISGEQIIVEMLSRAPESLKWCVVWTKLYKKTLLEGLWFNDYYCIQDQDFNIRVYKQIDKAAFITEPFYWYYENPNSLQRIKSLFPKKLYFNTKNRFRMLDYLSKEGIENKYRSILIDYGYRQILDRLNTERGSEYEAKYYETVNDIIKSTWKEYLVSPYIPFVKKVRFFFFWYCPNTADFYLKLFRRKK